MLALAHLELALERALDRGTSSQVIIFWQCELDITLHLDDNMFEWYALALRRVYVPPPEGAHDAFQMARLYLQLRKEARDHGGLPAGFCLNLDIAVPGFPAHRCMNRFVYRWIQQMPAPAREVHVRIEFANSPFTPASGVEILPSVHHESRVDVTAPYFMENDGVRTMRMLVDAFGGRVSEMDIKFVMVQDDDGLPPVAARARVLESVRKVYRVALHTVAISLELDWDCYEEWDHETWCYGDAYGDRLLWAGLREAELEAQTVAFRSDVEAHAQLMVAFGMGFLVRLGCASPLLVLAGEGDDWLRIFFHRPRTVVLPTSHVPW
jgi:hypothetical protein